MKLYCTKFHTKVNIKKIENNKYKIILWKHDLSRLLPAEECLFSSSFPSARTIVSSFIDKSLLVFWRYEAGKFKIKIKILNKKNKENIYFSMRTPHYILYESLNRGRWKNALALFNDKIFLDAVYVELFFS